MKLDQDEEEKPKEWTAGVTDNTTRWNVNVFGRIFSPGEAGNSYGNINY